MPDPDTPTLWVARSAFLTMGAESERTLPNESGGVLLGYEVVAQQPVGGSHLADTRLADTRVAGIRIVVTHVVVTHVVGPGPDAVHTRTAFVPDHAFHRREVARHYHASGRRWVYLGDWHSHPDGSSELSARDCATLQAIATSPAARAPAPLMIIVPICAEKISDSACFDGVSSLAAWRYGPRVRAPERRTWRTRSPEVAHALRVTLYDE